MYRKSTVFSALIAVIVALMATGVVMAAPAASVTIAIDILDDDADDGVFIGTTNIPSSVTFDNTAAPGPDNIGYGPFIDMYFPVNGADGAAGTSSPPDGVDYVTGSASYLGTSITEDVQTFPAGPLGTEGCGPTQSTVFHPYAVDTSFNPIPVCGTPGDKLVTFQLPFGSFTPDQPPATIEFAANLSNYADANSVLTLRAQGGFQFGEDPLDNPCCDPSLPTSTVYDANTFPSTGTITPTLMEIEKEYIGPEEETATGPNYPRSYDVTVTAAPGQTITDLDVFDYFDDNIVITGVTAPGGTVTIGGAAPSYPVGPVPSNDVSNELIVNYASLTGTQTFTIDFYVPLFNAGGTSIVAPGSGADGVTENRAYALGDWDPLDPRDVAGTDNGLGGDGTCPDCPPIETHENEPVVIQKYVNNLSDSENSPGDILEYTFQIQVSDFFALDDVAIADAISDGQRITSNPQIEFSQHGATFNNAVNGGNFEIREYFTGGTPGLGGLPDADAPTAAAGDTVLYIDLSQEVLDELGLNELLGGCVPAGGTGGPDPDCGTFNGGGTTVTITYQTTIQDEFTDDFPSGDRSVDDGDILTNFVDILPSLVLDTSTLSPTGASYSPDDDSAEDILIASGTLTKSIYAIRAFGTGDVTLNPGTRPQIRPGDEIIFRLQYEMPSTDFEEFVVTDYLPLPVLNASEITTFNDTVSDGSINIGTGIPAAGDAMWGPTPGQTNFANRRDALGVLLQNGTTVPTVATPGDTLPIFCGGDTISGPENAVAFCIGDFDDPDNEFTVVDILFSVTVSDDPFADGLFLTNFARGGTDSTNTEATASDGIIQFELREPILQIKKGIVGADNPGGSYDPDDTVPPGTTFNPPGSGATPPFSGPITGGDSGNVDNGLDSNASGLDAGDTVRFAVTIENTGGSGAYDIHLTDFLPDGLVCNAANLNLTVTQGDGTNIDYTVLSGGGICDFFVDFDGDNNDGIELIDPGAGTPVCQHPDVDPAKAVVIITYDLEIANTVAAGDILQNVATLTNYSSTDGGPNFLGDDETNYPNDDATIEIEGTIEKEIVSTSETDTSDTETAVDGDERPVAIGEIIRYQLVTRIPEGTTTQLELRDNLPAGLLYAGDANFAFISTSGTAITSSDGAINSAAPGIAGNAVTTPTAMMPTSNITGGTTSGEDVVFNFGNVANSENDDDAEFVVLEFDAVVMNIAGNQAGTELVNSATLRKGGEDLLDSETREVEIVEPSVQVTSKTQSADTGDAGDEITYTISITNSGNATAYEVVVTDVLPAFVTFDTGFTTVSGETPDNASEAAGTVTLTYDELAAGDSSEISFTVIVNNTVEPNDTWVNTAEVIYTSLPGDQGTSDATPGDSGDDNGERNGDGGVNDYEDDASTPAFTVDTPTVVKQVEHPSYTPVASVDNFAGGTYVDSTDDASTGISEHDGDLVDLTIGEEFSYIITVTYPEGTIENTYFQDDIAPQLAASDDAVIEILSAEVIYSGANLTGVPGVGSLTVNDTNGDGDGDQVQYGTPTTTVLNTPDGVLNDDDRVVIRITARMDDEDASGDTVDALTGVANVDGMTARNTAQLIYEENDAGEQTISDSVDVDIVEPDVAVTKVTDIGTDVDAGDTVQFTLTVENTGTAPAYNLEVTDTLPLDVVTPIVTFDAIDAGLSTCDEVTGWNVDSASAPDVVFTFDELAIGASCDITFTGIVTVDASPGETYTNNVEVTSFDSRDNVADEDNRNYTGGSDSSDITTADLSITKSFLATSEDHTDPGDTRTGASNATEVPLAIGEIIRYQLAVTLIEGEHEDLTISDNLPPGIDAIYDSAFTITIPADVTVPTAGLPSGATISIYNDDGTEAVAGLNAGTPDNFTLLFSGTTTNANTDNGTDEVIVVEFNALVLNSTVSNQRNANRDNTASVSEDVAQSTATSNTIYARIHEPLVEITKVASPTAGDAGDEITFTLTITNDNNAQGATAFNLNVVDVVPAQYTNVTVTSVPGGATDNSAGNTVDIDIPSLAQNASVTITYTAEVVTSVTPAEEVINTADLTWTSLPGNFGTDDGTGGNNTGSDLSDLDTDQGGGHDSGEDSGERNGSGTGNNDYNDSDSETVIVDNVAPVKALFITSEGHTDDDPAFDGTTGNERPVAIGEVVTFQLTTSIPEGTSQDVILSDVLVPGLEFIDGTVTVYTNSAATMNFADITDTIPTTAPGVAVPADAGGVPTDAGTYSYDSGTRTLEINLGDITNLDDDADPEQVIVLFDVVVANDNVTDDTNSSGVNDLGDIWTNEFSASVGGNTPVVSNEIGVIVEEPQPTITKTINAGLSVPTGTGPFDAGDTVVYDIVISNPSGANVTDAFDLAIVDNVDANLDLVNPIQFSGSITGTPTDTSDYATPGQSVNVTISQLAPGESLTIQVTTTVLATVTDAQIIANQSDMTWTSLPGGQGTGDATPGNSGDTNGERDDSGGVNDYSDTDDVDFTVAAAYDAVKTIQATSETHTDDASLPNDGDLSGDPNVPVAVGEVVTYRLATQLAEGTMVNLTLTDQLSIVGANPLVTPILDDSFTVTFLNAQAGTITSPTHGAVLEAANGATVSLFDAGGTPQITDLVNYNATTNFLQLDFGDLVNADGDADIEYVVIDFNVVVMNNADVTLGDIIANNYVVISDDFDGNPITRDTSNTVNVIVEEPQPTITKSINSTYSNPATTGPFNSGDTVVYDIVVSNPSGANVTDAFDIDIVDNVDANINLDSVQFVGTISSTPADTSDYAAPGQSVNVTIPQLAPDETLTIRVTTTVQNTVTLGQVIANQSDMTWTSLPGDNGTGDETPGNSGDTNGERDGSGGVNDYTDTDDVDFTVGGPLDTIKSIDGTSEAHTGDATADTPADPRPLVVGEVITYRLVSEVPEVTSPGVVITDILSTNIEYVPGSARISYNADNAITGTGTYGINEIDPTTPITPGFVGGTRELTFSVGQVINNDNDANTEQIIIEFEAVVVNTSDNTLGAIWANDFSIDLDNDGTDEDISNEVNHVVQEPSVTVDKVLVSPVAPAEADAGDTVTYQINVTAANGANNTDAFDVGVRDTLDGLLILNSVTLSNDGGYASITADNSTLVAGGTVDVVIDTIQAGTTLELIVTATVAATVEIGDTISNQATIVYTSLPGDQGTGDSTPGESGETNGERNGDGTGENDYTDTDTVDTDITIAGEIALVKSIAGTSEAHTGDATADTPADPRPLTIGEVITYRLVTTLPELTLPDVQVTDVLSTNIEFIPGSARISYVANNAVGVPSVASIQNEVTPTTAVPAGLISFGVTGPRELAFDIGAVTNNDNDADDELLVIEFEAVVVNTSDNTLGEIWANNFSVDIDNDGTDEETSNDVNQIVQEPSVTITKAIFGTPPDDALDQVVYDLTVTAASGANNTTAFDVRVLDPLYPDLFLDSVAVQSAPVYATNTDNSTLGIAGPVDITFSELRPGDSIVVRVTATVLTSVSPGESITNTATTTYTSLPGDNGTGDATPGDSGEDDGERNGDETGENDYTDDSDTVSFTVTSPEPQKSIAGTTNPDTDDTTADDAGDPRPVAVGEVVTYRLATILPESTSISFALEDILVDGIEFVTGSARVSYQADTAPSFDGDFAGIQNEIDPTFAFPASRVTFDGGTRTLEFDFGSIVNNDGDANAERIIVEFDVRVIDDAINSAGQIWANDYSVVIDEALPSETITSSTEVYIEVVEPEPTLEKTFSPDEQLISGNVTMTLVASNLASDGATAPLYDIDVTDILDDWLNVTDVTVTFNTEATTFGSSFTDNSTITPGFATGVTDDILIEIDGLPVDGVATITVEMEIDPDASGLEIPRTITNTADIIGDSMPDEDTFDRDYTDDATDDLDIVKPTLVVTKTDSIDPVVAGELVTYTITIENTGTPDYDATNVIFTDDLPTGFSVTRVLRSQGTCSPVAGGILTCNLGTIASGASATITIEGRVSNTVTDGTILNNIAYVTSDEGNDGNDGDDTPDDDDDERAEEDTTVLRGLDLEIEKTVNDSTPNEGDLITYTLLVTNNGPSDATNVVVEDSLPAGVTFSSFTPNTLPCSYAAPTLTCTFPMLEDGDFVEIGIRATVGTITSGTSITNTATVTSDEPETDTTNNEDDAIISVDTVDIGVTKVVDNATPNEGDTIVYSVTVRNNGPAQATGVAVMDDLNALTGVTFVSSDAATLLDDEGNPTTYSGATGAWTVGTLNPGSSRTLQITATVDAGAAAEPQPLVNVAVVSNVDQPDTNPDNDDDDASISVGGVDLSLEKVVDDNIVDEGQQITYGIILTNESAMTATNVVVTDDLAVIPITYVSHVAPGSTTYNPATGEWTIPSITGGQELRLNITVTVNGSTAGAQFTNIAEITSLDQVDGDPTNNDDDETVRVNAADVAVTKSVDNATAAEGDTIIYSISVTSNGPSRATNIQVEDNLPAGVTYVSDNAATLLDSANAPTTYNSGTGVWTIGLLNAGSNLTLEITATVDVGTTGTTINNTAVITNVDEGDTNPDNDDDDATVAVSGLDLEIEKIVDVDTPNVGDTVVYSLIVTNNGPADATGLIVTDDLSTLPLIYVSDDSGTTSTTYNSGTGDWTVGDLASGETIILNITAEVDTSASGTTVTNIAIITDVDQPDSDPTNNEDDAEISVGMVDIEVEKVVDNPAPSTGDDVTYTITVTNNGPSTATGIILDEDLPLDDVSLTYVSDMPSQGTFTPDAAGSTWDVGTLASGASATLDLTVTVNIIDGSIVNTASLNSVDQPDSDPDNNEDTATIVLGGTDLEVIKTVDNPTPEQGDTVVYTIAAVNNGPIDATSVIVVDILPPGITYVSDDAATVNNSAGAPTSFDPGTGNWTVGDLYTGETLSMTITVTVDVDGGSVINTAEISGDQPDSDPDNDIDDAVITVDSADLSLSKSVNTSTPQVGQNIVYTLILTNDGPNTAYNVEVTDTLPGDVTYNGQYLASQGTFDGSLWVIGEVPAGQAVSLEITVAVTGSTGDTTNIAEVTRSDQVDPDSTPGNGDPTEDDYAASNFAFDPPFGRKVFDDAGLPLLEWRIEWVNPGDAPLAITVIDPIPDGTTFEPGSLTCESPSGLLTTNECRYNAGNNSIVFDGVLFPDPGATPDTIESANNRLIISFLVDVDDDVEEVNNEATLNAITGDTVNVDNVWTRPDEPSAPSGPAAEANVRITKTAYPQIAFPGEELAWIIQVFNDGDTDAFNVRVTDSIPAQLTIENMITSVGDVSRNGNDVTWQIGTLPAGETYSLRVVTRVPSDLTESVTNTAYLIGDNFPTQESMAVAPVIEELPATGETPIWGALLKAVVPTLAIAAMTWAAIRRGI